MYRGQRRHILETTFAIMNARQLRTHVRTCVSLAAQIFLRSCVIARVAKRTVVENSNLHKVYCAEPTDVLLIADDRSPRRKCRGKLPFARPIVVPSRIGPRVLPSRRRATTRCRGIRSRRRVKFSRMRNGDARELRHCQIKGDVCRIICKEKAG